MRSALAAAFVLLLAGASVGPTPGPALVAPAAAAATSGTTFYAFGMDNFPPADCYCTEVFLANPWPAPVSATVQDCQGPAPPVTVGIGSKSFTSVSRVPDLLGNRIGGSVLRITSAQPLAAFQLNDPGVESWTSGGSQLLPLDSWGTEYLVPYTGPGVAPEGGLMAIVADAPTVVTITAKTTIPAFAGLPTFLAGVPFSFPMAACQSVQIESYVDMTGTLVTSSAPVALFAGHACGFAPSGLRACDHVQEQVWPTSRHGTSYVACRSEPQEEQWLRIMALAPGITGVNVGGTPYTLPGRGDFLDVQAGDVAVTSTQPVAVSLITEGGEAMHWLSDPSFSQVEPVAGLASEYLFGQPDGDWLQYFVTVAAPTGTVPTLDGNSMSGGSPAGGGYTCYRARTGAGYHEVRASAGVAVQFGGYYCTNAYLSHAARLAPGTSAYAGPAAGALHAVPCTVGAAGAGVPSCGAVPGNYIASHGRASKFATEPTDRAACWDPATSTWSSLPTALVKRYDAAAAGSPTHGYYLVAGGSGCIPGPLCDSVERFDVGTGTWSILATLPFPVAQPGAILFSSHLFVVGGRPCDSMGACLPTNMVQVVDLTTGTVSVFGGMPTPRSDLAALVPGTGCILFYAIGGNDGTQALATTDAFNSCLNTWIPSALPPMPHAAELAVGALLPGGVICVAGGWDGTDSVPFLQKFSGSSWSIVPDPGGFGFAISQAGNHGAPPLRLTEGPHMPMRTLPSC